MPNRTGPFRFPFPAPAPDPGSSAAPTGAPWPARVLVTGGAGFIGGHLAARLLRAGARVAVLDDFSTGRAENLPRHPSLRVIRGCVTDAAAVRAAGPVDAVFHCAGVVGMRLAVRERERAWRVAVRGTRTVIEATGDAALVLVSSSAVYGVDAPVPAGEHQAAGAAGLLDYDGGTRGYASGKLGMERLGRAAARMGRRVLIVRPFNVVGPRQTHAYGMVLPSFVRHALEGLPLEVHDDGLQTRCFSHVGTFVDALLRLARTPPAWARGGRVVNLGSATPTSIGELAELVLEETGSASPVLRVPYASVFPGRRDVRERIPDTSLLAELSGAPRWPGAREIVREVLAEVEAGERRLLEAAGAD
ncbi:MAG TPA: NAD-dependent epimerase/dehydratase family protein [Longimicrobium sp.]|nr:NAD-dependent epimerase/dehydratase family protein [Longimicrobium sp.]